MRILPLLALFLAACASTPVMKTPDISEAERVVQVQLEAYNARDVEAFAATYADDVRIYDYPDRLRYEGIDTLRARYGEAFRSGPDVRARISKRIVQGNFVIDHEHVTGRPDGVDVDAVAIYEVRNGRIQAVWFIR